MTRRLLAVSISTLLIAMAGCSRQPAQEGQAEPATATPAATSPAAQSTALNAWPHTDSAITSDPAIEARVKEIVGQMTLAQKVGQMTQPEIKTTTPEDVKTYYLGSVLNGGGSWPAMNKHAKVSDWLDLSERYYDASMATDMKTPVPIIWGTDAMHGHSNIYGATLFPHAIGLGAAHDPVLLGKIAAATGKGVRATGIQWLFAPAVPVALNPRWGRTYESWSQDPAQVREYAKAYTEALQGSFKDDANAVASVKHFVGDGGTENGKDQGVARTSLKDLINIHGAGYFGAIGAGAQTVMVSYSSWFDTDNDKDYGKLHGSRELLTDALKDKIGFDGFIVSDYNGIGQIPGCTNASCAQAVNAGIDMFMVPDDWKAFIANTIKQVESGEISMSRIDDAVSRIIRVKLRAGLFDGKKPSQNAYAGKDDALQNRDLAREAVRKSLVLLKNNGNALPLTPGKKVLVVGKSADNVPNQAGGWSITWQGTDTTNADYPNADTVLSGIREAVGADNVSYSATADGVDVSKFDAVVAVIGETPYAEMVGDIVATDTVSHSRRFPEDLKVLQAVHGKGKPVVTVFLSGRPLYANDLLNLSDAFVAAWLPGTEGKGIADVLVAGEDGKPRHDFSGNLSFGWPGVACPGPRGVGKDGAKPQFNLGYGLSYAKPATTAALTEDKAENCGTPTEMAIFNRVDPVGFALHVGSAENVEALGADLNRTLEWPKDKPVVRVRTVQVNTQQDAKEVTWLAPARLFSRNPSRSDLQALAKADGALAFDMSIHAQPQKPVQLAMECGGGCKAEVNLTPVLKAMPLDKKQTVKIPLQCFAERGLKLETVDTPFSISADAPFSASFTNIRVLAGAGKDADVVDCAKL